MRTLIIWLAESRFIKADILSLMILGHVTYCGHKVPRCSSCSPSCCRCSDVLRYVAVAPDIHGFASVCTLSHTLTTWPTPSSLHPLGKHVTSNYAVDHESITGPCEFVSAYIVCHVRLRQMSAFTWTEGGAGDSLEWRAITEGSSIERCWISATACPSLPTPPTLSIAL